MHVNHRTRPSRHRREDNEHDQTKPSHAPDAKPKAHSTPKTAPHRQPSPASSSSAKAKPKTEHQDQPQIPRQAQPQPQPQAQPSAQAQEPPEPEQQPQQQQQPPQTAASEPPREPTHYGTPDPQQRPIHPKDPRETSLTPELMRQTSETPQNRGGQRYKPGKTRHFVYTKKIQIPRERGWTTRFARPIFPPPPSIRSLPDRRGGASICRADSADIAQLQVGMLQPSAICQCFHALSHHRHQMRHLVQAYCAPRPAFDLAEHTRNQTCYR